MQIFNHTHTCASSLNIISFQSFPPLGPIDHPTRAYDFTRGLVARIHHDDDVHDDVSTPRVIHNLRVDNHNHARKIFLRNIHVVFTVTRRKERTTRGV